ncbi:MAG: hypothetical protein ACO1SV_02505 [Fimbriimonas sp.]
MKSAFPLLAVTLLFVGGCGDSDTVPKHSPEEEKAMQEMKSLTPEQQIERIQNGGMPEAAKQAMIQDIKTKHGLK